MTNLKQSGLGDNYYYSGNDLSGDVNSISKLSTPLAVIESTDITQSARAQLPGLRSAELDWVSYFDPATAHPVLSALPRTDQTAMYCRGTLIGSPAFCCQGVQLNYDPTRGADGSLTCAISVQSDGFGGEWGELLTPGKQTDTGASNGQSQDDGPYLGNGVSTQFGAQAYLQVFAVSGGSPDIIIQHSANNNAWSTLVDFGAQGAAPVVVRGTSSGVVNRYLRVISTGAFTSVTYAVMINRNVIPAAF
jgi:hypothetical protein